MYVAYIQICTKFFTFIIAQKLLIEIFCKLASYFQWLQVYVYINHCYSKTSISKLITAILMRVSELEILCGIRV